MCRRWDTDEPTSHVEDRQLIPYGGPGGPYTTSTISVSPNPTNPGTTVTATSTHQILGLPPQGDQIQLFIFLTGTNGNGTLSTGTSSSGGTCTLDASTSRQWSCVFASGSLSVGDTVTLTAPVNVSGATPTPDTFGLESQGRILSGAQNQPDSFAETELAVEAVQPSTTTTATSVPDQTTTVPASTGAPTTGSGGVSPTLPATGSETEWLTLFGLLALAAGLGAVGYARRPSSS